MKVLDREELAFSTVKSIEASFFIGVPTMSACML